MKTKELVKKYQEVLGGLLKVEPEHVSFQLRPTTSYEKRDWCTIGSVLYPADLENDKPEVTVDWGLGEYQVLLDAALVSSFKLYQLPHCCGIIVFCKAEVWPNYRHMRVGTALNNMRQDIGRAMGYSLALCTDIVANTPQTKLLATNSWRVIESFVNRRTGNLLNISVISL